MTFRKCKQRPPVTAICNPDWMCVLEENAEPEKEEVERFN